MIYMQMKIIGETLFVGINLYFTSIQSFHAKHKL